MLSQRLARKFRLVVDDNVDLRNFVVLYLRQAGYRVFAASNFDEASSVLMDSANKIDLLATDVELPDSANRLQRVGGLQLAEIARQAANVTRAVFMTGGILDEEIEKAAMNHGALLVKPFGMKVLLQAIRNALDRP